MPELEKLRSEFGPRGVGFMAISLEQELGAVKEAARAYGITMPVASARSEMLGPFNLHGVPSTLLVAADGKVVLAVSGARSLGYFRDQVNALLLAPSSSVKPGR